VVEFDIPVDIEGNFNNNPNNEATISEASTVEAEFAEDEMDVQPPAMSICQIQHRSLRTNTKNPNTTSMVAEAHYHQWCLDCNAVLFDVMGLVRCKKWVVQRVITGDIFQSGCNIECRFSKLNIF
jgi:hypothetical protein